MIAGNSFIRLKERASRGKQIIGELNSLFTQLDKAETQNERNMVLSHMTSLKKSLRETNQDFLGILKTIGVTRPLNPKVSTKQDTKIQKPIRQRLEPTAPEKKKFLSRRDFNLFLELEKETIKRLHKKEKKIIEKKDIHKPNKYVEMSNRYFSSYAKSLIKKEKFYNVQRSIIKSKLRFVPSSYISVLFFTTAISGIAAIFVFLFFLFFNIGVELPIITLAGGSIGLRFLKVFWILFAIPAATFLFMYLYPFLEEKASEQKINEELPLATIHMAAISGSMVDPSKIFNIIISTKEYPYLSKEFTRLMNEINIYGYDLINALKSISLNSPSKKLSELLNGLATTIESGGNLSEFFKKRSETLLFDYKIDREKRTKSSETFMDIYISVVIAAPMILMLLLIMMKISGLGISLSTSMITLMTILGVFLVNIVFLTFLQLKQPSE